MYRMVYVAIPIGAYLQRSGNFGDYASSPVLTWDDLEIAKRDADWNQTTVVTGYYKIIDANGQEVYRSKEGMSNE